MGQLANLAIMGTWLGQTYIEESEKKKARKSISNKIYVAGWN